MVFNLTLQWNHPILNVFVINLVNHLVMLAEIILEKLLPEDETHSDILRFLVRECFANVVLKELVDQVSDPFFINSFIVKVFIINPQSCRFEPLNRNHTATTQDFQPYDNDFSNSENLQSSTVEDYQKSSFEQVRNQGTLFKPKDDIKTFRKKNRKKTGMRDNSATNIKLTDGINKLTFGGYGKLKDGLKQVLQRDNDDPNRWGHLTLKRDKKLQRGSTNAEIQTRRINTESISKSFSNLDDDKRISFESNPEGSVLASEANFLQVPFVNDEISSDRSPSPDSQLSFSTNDPASSPDSRFYKVYDSVGEEDPILEEFPTSPTTERQETQEVSISTFSTVLTSLEKFISLINEMRTLTPEMKSDLLKYEGIYLQEPLLELIHEIFQFNRNCKWGYTQFIFLISPFTNLFLSKMINKIFIENINQLTSFSSITMYIQVFRNSIEDKDREYNTPTIDERNSMRYEAEYRLKLLIPCILN